MAACEAEAAHTQWAETMQATIAGSEVAGRNERGAALTRKRFRRRETLVTAFA